MTDKLILPPEILEKVPAQLRHQPAEQIVALYAKAIERDQKENRLRDYKPYPKQAEFHALGAHFRERMFFAGNQLGKTRCAAAEVAFHLTGEYPEGWVGKRFTKAPEIWVASEDYELLRDVAQAELFGPADDFGTGMVPKRCIKKAIPRSGVAGAMDTVLVKHKSGGTSRVKFKSYKEGRAEFQGKSELGVLWFDEEPKSEDSIGLYIEALTRTNALPGITMITFTPLKGSTQLVNRFEVDKFPGTAFVRMGIHDVGHYTPEQRAAIIAQYPEHEREARTEGYAKLGAGAVFGSIDPKKIQYSNMEIPDHWFRICGQDYGYTHPTAFAWIAQDRDSNKFYVYDVYAATEEKPAEHFAAWQSRGEHIPVAWPHDGRRREPGTGEQLAAIYRKLGVKMLSEPAMLPKPAVDSKKASKPNGGPEDKKPRMSVEQGILLMIAAMNEGRFYVAKHLEKFWEEFRLYHRNERTGRIVDKNDDIISATRYAFIMAMQGHGVQRAGRRLLLPRGKKYNSRYA